MTSTDIIQFRPPQATIGTQVIWYRHGKKRTQDATIGYLVHCGNRTATIYLCTGRRVDAVRHINDPKLSLSSEQREQGAWDFTQDYYETRDRIKFLEGEVRKLMSAVMGDKQKSNSAEDSEVRKKRQVSENVGNGLREFRELKRKAEEMGLNHSGMRLPELRSAIEKASTLADPSESQNA